MTDAGETLADVLGEGIGALGQLRQEFLEAYKEVRRLQEHLKDAQARKAAAEEALLDALRSSGLRSIRDESGALISIRRREFFSVSPEDREKLLRWVPSEHHTVNSQTFQALIKGWLEEGHHPTGCARCGCPRSAHEAGRCTCGECDSYEEELSEETLPPWIRRATKEALSVRFGR